MAHGMIALQRIYKKDEEDSADPETDSKKAKKQGKSGKKKGSKEKVIKKKA